ncbi:MAG: hypothetical protein HY076_02580 [Candidatus Eisenbacteria bacterium]|uniref:Uncharacterized protein n=1 Tax=Eiseniibacteriota bacterium TaxID=2212470 RepID=A0A9D6L5G6_UNCEI|nr:hypothetical protein [Candidatus Eisenbacteria bacterium]MBI3539141.1 hypothetical protein [Candidatus Eisenbacteria bacterium]
MTTTELWTGARPLREALYGDLAWRRPHLLARDLVLEAGSERLAMLGWEKIFSMQATAIAADGRWTIGRHMVGPLKSQVIVRDAASEAVVATFERHWRGTGVVRFANGAEYRWARSGFWHPSWTWASNATESLLAFRARIGFGVHMDMEVDPAAHRLGELPVLVLLGAYLMTMVVRRRRAH